MGDKQKIADGLLDEARLKMSENDFEVAESSIKKAIDIFPSPAATDLLNAINRIKSGYSDVSYFDQNINNQGYDNNNNNNSSNNNNNISNNNANKQKHNKMSALSDEERDKIIEKILNSTEPHIVLGVREDASENEIKNAFHNLVKVVHPDKCRNERASDAFRALQIAKNKIDAKE